ncbi:MAG: glycosyltransferase family 2 protein [Verrucomicrobiota bacterium]
MSQQFQHPIALIVYRRPESVAKLMACLGRVKPTKLYVIADVPRDPKWQAECDETFAIATNPSWNCELFVDRAKENLGCRRRISSGVDWVFSQEETVVVLEDDLEPADSFFPFCAELLERYRDDKRIMHIGGNNHQQGIARTPDSYYFSKHTHCWGWASWRRAWQHFDHELTNWPTFRDGGFMERVCPDPLEREYFAGKLDGVLNGDIDSWAYIWTYSCWRQNGLGIIPAVNLVANHGFDDSATHTKGSHALQELRAEELSFPLQHPTGFAPNEAADHYAFYHHFEGNAIRAARSPMGKIRQWRNGALRRMKALTR